MTPEERQRRADSLLRIAKTRAHIGQYDFVSLHGVESPVIIGEIYALDAYFAEVAEDEKATIERMAQDAHDREHDLQEPRYTGHAERMATGKHD